MPVFCQLTDPANYRASEWNIAADPWDRDYWLGLFGRFPRYIEPMLRQDAEQAGLDFDAKWAQFVPRWQVGLAEIRGQMQDGRGMMTIDLTRYRNRMLAEFGWPDPYRRVKAHENRLAAKLYPSVIKRIDATPAAQRWESLIRGVFAGNMFDLGSPKTIEMYQRGEIEFQTILENVPPRPWFRDDADELIKRLRPPGKALRGTGSPRRISPQADFQPVQMADRPARCRSHKEADRQDVDPTTKQAGKMPVPHGPKSVPHESLNPPGHYRQAMIFVDNAGTDIVLGVVPLAREMARAGIRVVLAANDGPALNDILISELRPLLRTLADDDAYLSQMLASDHIAAVGSGGDTPLIDLGYVSEECNAEAARSDLIVLEGMGRGVESNWDRQFKCDVWRVALLKDESVVRFHRAKLFDAVCRFDPA